MTIPALPADDTDGQDWTAAKVNAVYDHLQLWRDNLPVLRVGSTNQSIASSVTSYANLSDPPAVNNGGWTDTGTTYNGWNVPESGVYRVTAHAIFTAYSVGYRYVAIADESSARLSAAVASLGDGADTRINATDIFALTAGDEIGVLVYHTAGLALLVSTALMAEFLYAI